MDFLEALKEALSFGISKDDFLDIWKKEAVLNSYSKGPGMMRESCSKPPNIKIPNEASTPSMEAGKGSRVLETGDRHDDIQEVLHMVTLIAEEQVLHKIMIQGGHQLHQSAIKQLQQISEKLLTEHTTLQNLLEAKFSNAEKILEDYQTSEEHMHQKVHNVLTLHEMSQKDMFEKIDKMSLEFQNSQKQLHQKIDNISTQHAATQKQKFEKTEITSSQQEWAQRQLPETTSKTSSKQDWGQKQVHEEMDKISLLLEWTQKQVHDKFDNIISEHISSQNQLRQKIDTISTNLDDAQKQMHDKIIKISLLQEWTFKQLNEKIDEISSQREGAQKQIHEKIDKMSSQNESAEKEICDNIYAISLRNEGAQKQMLHKIVKDALQQESAQKQMHQEINKLSSQHERALKLIHERFKEMSFEHPNTQIRLHLMVDNIKSKNESVQKHVHAKIDKISSQLVSAQKHMHEKIEKLSSQHEGAQKHMFDKIDKMSSQRDGGHKQMFDKIDKMSSHHEDAQKQMFDKIDKMSSQRNSGHKQMFDKIDKMSSHHEDAQKHMFDKIIKIFLLQDWAHKQLHQEIDTVSSQYDSAQEHVIEKINKMSSEHQNSQEQLQPTIEVQSSQHKGALKQMLEKFDKVLAQDQPLVSQLIQKMHKITSEHQSSDSTENHGNERRAMSSQESNIECIQIKTKEVSEVGSKHQYDSKLKRESSNGTIDSIDSASKLCYENFSKLDSTATTAEILTAEANNCMHEKHEYNEMDIRTQEGSSWQMLNLETNKTTEDQFMGNVSTMPEKMTRTHEKALFAKKNSANIESGFQETSKMDSIIEDTHSSDKEVNNSNNIPEINDVTVTVKQYHDKAGQQQIQQCSSEKMENDAHVSSCASFQLTIESVVQKFEQELTKCFRIVYRDYLLQVVADFYSDKIEIYLQSVYTKRTESLSWPAKLKVSMALGDNQTNSNNGKNKCGHAVTKEISLKKPIEYALSNEEFLYFFKRKIVDKYVLEEKFNLSLILK